MTEIYGPQFVRRISDGEPFDTDVVILQPRLIDELIRDGRLVGTTRSNLVQIGIGVEVRAGTPKPDIGSVEAFKRALLNAKSIAYLKSGVEAPTSTSCLGSSELQKPWSRSSHGRKPTVFLH